MTSVCTDVCCKIIQEAEVPEPPLSLYVWENVLCDYTCGVMFALAHDAEEARQLIRATEIGSWGAADADLGKSPEVITEPMGFAVYGGG